jgi:hypothetical protein
MIASLIARLTGLFSRKPVPAQARVSPSAPPSQAAPNRPDANKSLIMTLQDKIRSVHKCESVHAESLPLNVDAGGKIIWQGRVEVFTLKGHPKAKRCYAWMHPPARPTQCKVVLEIPPIDSPRKAVYSTVLKESGNDLSFSTSSQFLAAVKTTVRRDPRG